MPADQTAPVRLDAAPISLLDVERVALGLARVELAQDAVVRIDASRERLEAALGAGTAIYGVNTGFGSLSRTRIVGDKLSEMQHNLLRSHASGVGEPLAPATVRAMLLLLAASLARGCSGVRVGVVESIVALLNADITPVVPSIGSVGASGDLAPLAHAALVLIGEGEAWVDGARTPGGDALRKKGLGPIELAQKEGLALINGTHLMAGAGALALREAGRLFDAALVACAMSIDACRATDAFLDPRVHAARNQPAQAVVADRLRALLEGSRIVTEHRANDPRVQDPYSLRCAPQVLGAALDTLDHARRVVEQEIGGVTDNPLVLEPAGGFDAPVISAGNFHGMALALALDCAAIAVAHIAGIAERRVFFLLGATDPQNPVPAHLSPQPGLHSGLMITQYTAAACCNELIHLSTPASAANISTCAGMEDYNSFGPLSASKLARAVGLARQVVAIELLCAAQGLEHQRPLTSGAGVERAHAAVRAVVPRLEADRPPAPDIAAIAQLVEQGRLSGE